MNESRGIHVRDELITVNEILPGACSLTECGGVFLSWRLDNSKSHLGPFSEDDLIEWFELAALEYRSYRLSHSKNLRKKITPSARLIAISPPQRLSASQMNSQDCRT